MRIRATKIASPCRKQTHDCWPGRRGEAGRGPLSTQTHAAPRCSIRTPGRPGRRANRQGLRCAARAVAVPPRGPGGSRPGGVAGPGPAKPHSPDSQAKGLKVLRGHFGGTALRGPAAGNRPEHRDPLVATSGRRAGSRRGWGATLGPTPEGPTAGGSVAMTRDAKRNQDK